MTAEEAISVLDSLLDGNIFDTMNYWYDHLETFYTALETSKDALKKQIPMKPILCNDEDLTCPTCGADVEWKYYCEECGQKIDHEEE